MVKVLRTHPLAGTVDGKAMFASLFEVTFAPGDSSAPHYHPGEVVGYVAEGTLEFKITGKPLKTLKAGGTFFEPAMIRHEVARNPDAKQRCRVIFTLVHPRNVKRLTIPAVEIDAQQAVRSDKLNSAAARIWFLASFRCLQRSSNPAASSQCLMKSSSRLMKADRRILGSKTDKQ
ncbi:cupin domain-containing protein [Fuerstiella marisgermanici]|uniref:Cupin domain protein n=1 Tax=Fuerstiella marisgermanici TaxID=1891926 RepID=A0A1P8W8V4_9PLAN|nr:cupin domain-containing protein [Fuerstiella marisgermanici]APZ90494.1 Cupin domain protein [Fuerstiella marisgermanici]